MCGIFFVQSKKFELSKARADEALNLMQARGPDQWSSEEHRGVYLGHRRLSILDLEDRSRQPFVSSCGRYTIVFNGEIYNFRELQKRYNLDPRTTSDTEILIELFVLLGEKCLDHLIGMFAFVIYDSHSGDIFVARDRLGIKPLYYYEGDNLLIFSSEIAPIIHYSRDSQLDEIGIRQYLKMRTTFRGHTIYRNIKQFPPGTYYKNGRHQKYWHLEQTQSEWRDEDVENLLRSAIQYRLIADVPVGSYLSGGLDSSVITAIAKTQFSYTVGFHSSNEFDWSDTVAQHVGTEHIKVLVDQDVYKDTMDWMIDRRQEPLCVPNEVLIYLMTKEVKKRNTVVLSGEGADELFFGYDRIFKWAHDFPWSLQSFDQFYSYGLHRDDDILDYVIQPYANIRSNEEKVARFFQLDHLEGLLRRLDYCTMLCSVEARVPFVDHRLIEYMYGAPRSYRAEKDIVKAPLKRIAGALIPRGNIHRKKVGFPVPLAQMYGADTHREGMDIWLDRNMKRLIPDWAQVRSDILSRL